MQVQLDSALIATISRIDRQVLVVEPAVGRYQGGVRSGTPPWMDVTEPDSLAPRDTLILRAVTLRT
jgi:hypothetical protein